MNFELAKRERLALHSGIATEQEYRGSLVQDPVSGTLMFV